MRNRISRHGICAVIYLTATQSSFAITSGQPWYVAARADAFQTNSSTHNTSRANTIFQNIRRPAKRNLYTFTKDNSNLSATPGLSVTDTASIYGRIVFSYVSLSEELNSPTGYTPAYINNSNTRDLFGAALGLGFKKITTNRIAVFSEYTFHDYGAVKFPNFLNAAASYNRSAHVYTNSVIFGISYSL